MLARINLREVSKSDRFAPDEEYAIRGARVAECLRPSVYRVDGDILHVDLSKAQLTVEQICFNLHWGVQWNDL